MTDGAAAARLRRRRSARGARRRGARASPSIRHATSRSRRRPAPARRACWSIATSGCSPPASSRATSSRSPSRARPRPKCGSASCRSSTRRHAKARSRRSCGARFATASTDIAISTIDAFCLALLREFPLEADVDPGFDLADETETPRLVDEALERTLRDRPRPGRRRAEMALLFAELGEFRLREGLARLIDRRLVAWDALGRFLRGAAHRDDRRRRCAAAGAPARGASPACPAASAGLIASGPAHPDFALLARDLRRAAGRPAAVSRRRPRRCSSACASTC